MLAYLAPIFVFGLVIFVHELGHFIAAKLTGVYAPRFSIGFGPALFRMRRGETEYVLAALPLGGYVRMASRHDAETAFIEGGNEETGALKPDDAGYDPEAMMPFGPKPVPESRWFESKSLVQRLFIMIAGVTMNILLAFVIYSAMNVIYGEPVIGTRVVGAVRAVPNAPALSQLAPGDTIAAVNGQPVSNWGDIIDRIEAAPAGTIAIKTQRSTVEVPVGSSGAPTAKQISDAIDFHIPPVIGEVLPGSAALKAGMKAGDTVVAISGQAVRTWPDLVKLVSASPGVELAIDVKRAGAPVSLQVTPLATPERDTVTKTSHDVGRIGAAVADFTARQSLGPVAALEAGARQTWFSATQIIVTVRKLFTRQISVKELGGPIAITRASVAAGQSGFAGMFLLIALLSVNVAVLNLLPIPILDGGQILINIAEAAKGSAFSSRTREYILRVGLVAILLIFAMSTYNDVVRLVRDKLGGLFG
ncbi:MAG: RIP metalloprotease RseP [bacterium]